MPFFSVFTALGQPTRWPAFQLLLSAGEEGMLQGRIAEGLDVDKNLMSVHLKVLHAAGLVTKEKNGREVTYRVASGPAHKAATQLLTSLDEAAGKAQVTPRRAARV